LKDFKGLIPNSTKLVTAEAQTFKDISINMEDASLEALKFYWRWGLAFGGFCVIFFIGSMGHIVMYGGNSYM